MTEGERAMSELDVLSPRAATILRDGPPGRYRKLVLPLGPADPSARAKLGTITPQQLLVGVVEDESDASAMLAGLWLWFDGMKEAHEIAQDLVSPTGSFWHAILHRREGDFSNARYWYGRCRPHRANRLLGVRTQHIAGKHTNDPIVQSVVASEWNGSAFVDLVEAVADHPDDPRYQVAADLQQAEWQALFSHCALAASGSPLD